MAIDLENRMRGLLDGLREGRQPVPCSAEIQNALVLAISAIRLNRPSRMTRLQDAYVELMIEEAEQFAELVNTVALEIHDGFSRQQRSSFIKIIMDLRRDLERFTSDALLAIGDIQELRRRIDTR